MVFTPIYRSLQDVPYPARERVGSLFLSRAETLFRQANIWDKGGYHSNAAYWRKQARIAELDNYRLMVYLGRSEEDEDLEDEIRDIITA